MHQREPATGIRLSTVGKLLLLAILLIISNIVARDAMQSLDFSIRPSTEDAVHRTIMLSAGIYSILLAIPFVPGAEVGIALMAMLGPKIAFLVYVCTLVGLSLSYTLGRLVPLATLARMAHDCRLDRTSRLLHEIAPLDKRQRMALLVDRAPKRFVPYLLRYRYLALAVALNIPGNYLIGGGGGIALFAGLSRLYSVPGFLLTIVLAVAPVPLAVTIFGIELLPK